MNTKIIAIIVGLVILVGAGGYFLSQNKNASQTSNNPSSASQNNNTDAMTPTSLADLLLGGKTQTCTFSNTKEDGSSTQGTVYLSGTKMRGDITSTTKDNKTSTMYMIRDGDTSYVWGSALPQGIKMTVTQDELKTNTQANQYLDTTTKTDYKCSTWTVDPSKFSVPSDVKFTDVSAMMPKATGTQTQAGPGYSCAGITDPTAKAACEASLQQ